MKKARQRRAFSRPLGAVSCRILPSAKQAGQALRRAPHQIPHKSPALPDFYTSARAVPQGTFSCPEGAIHLAAARPRPLCGREGVIAPGFSGTGGVSKGDSVPLRRRKRASACLSPAARSYHGRRARENAGGIRSDPPVLRCWRPRGSCPCPFLLQLGR